MLFREETGRDDGFAYSTARQDRRRIRESPQQRSGDYRSPLAYTTARNYDEFQHHDDRASQHINTEADLVSQQRLSSSPPASSTTGTLRIVIVLIFLAWLGGFKPNTINMRSPLDLASAIVPGLNSHVSRMMKSTSSSSLSEHTTGSSRSEDDDEEATGLRPDFVYEHPYVSSSYYTSTKSIHTLMATDENQVVRNLRREAEEAVGMDDSSPKKPETKTRLAIVRPFCEFDAEALPTTFTCWNALPPCKAASGDVGDEDEGDNTFELAHNGELYAYKNNTEGRHLFDLVGSDAMKNAKADVFLFYSQT